MSDALTESSLIPIHFLAEAEKEIRRLESLIITTLHDLHQVTETVQQLHTEIDNFLVEYYDKVGGLFTELAQLNVAIRAFDASFLPSEEILPAYRVPEPKTPLKEEEVKKLYRKLVKFFHPDAGEISYENDRYFSLLHQAYKQKDLPTLLQIDQLVKNKKQQEEPLDSKLLRLSQHYDGLLETLKTLRNKKEVLLNSPACQLKQKVEQATLNGQDLIQTIQENVDKKIKERRALLERKKYSRAIPYEKNK